MLSARALVRAHSWWATAALLLVLAVVVAIRIRLLALPLERDEGEYAYAGQLLLQGVPPYQELDSMKWPGTFAVYALSMAAFGQSVAAIHGALILSNLLTTAIVFLIGRRIYGPISASIAAGTFALLSISPPTLGLAAHATHFVLLPALAGIVLLQNLDEDRRAWRVVVAGLLFGMAALMKQSGAIFGLFGALWLLRLENSGPKRDVRRLSIRLAWMAAGALLPLGATCAILVRAGVFARFWFWTVQYGQTYAGLVSPLQGLTFLGENGWRLFQAAPGLWSLALLGLVWLWFSRNLQPWRFFLVGFSLFSFLAVCPGWYFREHYFLLLLPAVGLLAGAAAHAFSGVHPSPGAASSKSSAAASLDGTALVSDVAVPGDGRTPGYRGAFAGPNVRGANHARAETIALIVFACAAAWSLFISRVLFFKAPPEMASRLLYPGNAFPECLQLGRYLSEHCSADARIAVLGSEPELFFYSRRRSATGHIYMYPLMEPQPYAKVMQEDMIREITAANPQYFVFVGVSSSWLPHPDSDLSIMTWFEAYRREHLCPVALVQLFSDDHIEYDWSESNKPEAARAKRWLEVYRRTEK